MASNANNEEYDFVKKPSDKYYCPVTFELLTDPRQTSECCGNRLSGAAAEQLEAEGKPCSLCKKAPLKTTMDLCFKREVMELKVYCSKKSAGCEWKGELGELECHLKLKSVEGKCRFVDVQCPLECGKRIQRRHLQDHQSDKCEKRPFNCKYCDYKATYEKVVHNHWPKCERYPEVCPNKCSDEVIERQFLQRHLDEKCQLQEIRCKYSSAGCQAKMTRKAMKAHLETEMDEHVIMVLSAKFTKLESKMNYLILAFTLILALLSFTLILAFTQIAPKPVFIPLLAFEIVMTDFDKLKNDGTRWYSAQFYTHSGGYKMCLGIDANGWGAGVGTHVSIAVFMMKGEFDSHLKWPFRGEITVQLVNQKEGGENYERKPVSNTDNKDRDRYFQRVIEGEISVVGGWGNPKFISHTDLYNPDEGKEYLQSDTLIFKLKVTEVTVASV